MQGKEFFEKLESKRKGGQIRGGLVVEEMLGMGNRGRPWPMPRFYFKQESRKFGVVISAEKR